MRLAHKIDNRGLTALPGVLVRLLGAPRFGRAWELISRRQNKAPEQAYRDWGRVFLGGLCFRLFQCWTRVWSLTTGETHVYKKSS